LSAGNISGLWSEPVAVVVYIIVALVLLAPLVLKVIRKRRPDSVLAGNIPLAADETVATNDDEDKDQALPEHDGNSGGVSGGTEARHRAEKNEHEKERS
jgi:putative tricarboxylic transport membrane protein